MGTCRTGELREACWGCIEGRYALSGKRITLIGISFSAEKRTIVEELVEELPA